MLLNNTIIIIIFTILPLVTNMNLLKNGAIVFHIHVIWQKLTRVLLIILKNNARNKIIECCNELLLMSPSDQHGGVHHDVEAALVGG